MRLRAAARRAAPGARRARRCAQWRLETARQLGGTAARATPRGAKAAGFAARALALASRTLRRNAPHGAHLRRPRFGDEVCQRLLQKSGGWRQANDVWVGKQVVQKRLHVRQRLWAAQVEQQHADALGVGGVVSRRVVGAFRLFQAVLRPETRGAGARSRGAQQRRRAQLGVTTVVAAGGARGRLRRSGSHRGPGNNARPSVRRGSKAVEPPSSAPTTRGGRTAARGARRATREAQGAPARHAGWCSRHSAPRRGRKQTAHTRTRAPRPWRQTRPPRKQRSGTKRSWSVAILRFCLFVVHVTTAAAAAGRRFHGVLALSSLTPTWLTPRGPYAARDRA